MWAMSFVQQGGLSVGVDDKTQRDAWYDYYAQTRRLRGKRYEHMEPFAWALLQARLGNLKVRRVRHAA